MKEKVTHYSRQRERILKFVRNTTEHPTAETIYIKMREIMPNISLGTVYRNLKFLEEAGEIKRISVQTGMERYDARMDEHAHFVCTSCGRVYDLSKVDIEKIFSLISGDTESYPVWMNLSFGGICEECKRMKTEHLVMQFPEKKERKKYVIN